MLYQWEEHDICCGRQVDSHNRAERYMIGYDPTVMSEEGNRILVSLRDGMLATAGLTESAMADHLNEAKMRPVDVCPSDTDAEPN